MGAINIFTLASLDYRTDPSLGDQSGLLTEYHNLDGISTFVGLPAYYQGTSLAWNDERWRYACMSVSSESEGMRYGYPMNERTSIR